MQIQVPSFILKKSCPDGGIGRRAGFKIRFPRGSEGSTPSPGTTYLTRSFLTHPFMEATIRRGRESDMSAVRDILNHYILHSVVTFEMVELSLENRKTWFTQFSETGRYQLFVAVEEDQVVGYAASLRFHQRPAYAPSVMSSIYLHPKHTGKGIGEKVYSELMENMKQAEDVHRVYGLVVLPNPGSERLHEKLGFKVAGLLHEGGYKFGDYHDVRMYEHRLGK